MSDRADRYFADLMAQVVEVAPEPPEWPGPPPQPLDPVRRPLPGWAVATVVAFIGVLLFVGLAAVFVRDRGRDAVAAPPSVAASFATADGVILRGELWEASADGIVVVGAYGAAVGELDPITAALAGRGFTVLRYDPRGQGRSGGSVEPALLDDDLGDAVAFLAKRVDAVYVIGYLHSGAAALAAAGEGRLDVEGLVGLFPMDRYLEQDALAVAGGVEVPLLLIGGSDQMAQAVPAGTDFRSVAPDPAIFTKSGPRIAELVAEFIKNVGS